MKKTLSKVAGLFGYEKKMAADSRNPSGQPSLHTFDGWVLCQDALPVCDTLVLVLIFSQGNDAKKVRGVGIRRFGLPNPTAGGYMREFWETKHFGGVQGAIVAWQPFPSAGVLA